MVKNREINLVHRKVFDECYKTTKNSVKFLRRYFKISESDINNYGTIVEVAPLLDADSRREFINAYDLINSDFGALPFASKLRSAKDLYLSIAI